MAQSFQNDTFQTDIFEAGDETYAISIDAGVYSQVGNPITLTNAVGSVAVDAGVYAQVGNPITLSLVLMVAQGVYTQTGNDVLVGIPLALEMDAGVYTQTGNPVTLNPTYRVDVTVGAYSQTGSVLGLYPTYRLNPLEGEYTQTYEFLELLSARPEEYYLNFIVDLYPTLSAPTSQLFGERLTVGGRVIKVKSWTYEENPQSLVGTLSVELANVEDRVFVTKDSYLKFEIMAQGSWEVLVDTGLVAQSDYALAPLALGKPDAFSLSGFSILRLRLEKVPSTNTILYDPSRNEALDQDDFEGIYNEGGSYTPPLVVPTGGLSLYSVLSYAFGDFETNIPNFPIAIIDFQAGVPYASTINGVIGMFSPDYSVVGDTLWIRDGTSGSPNGFPAPRALGVSNGQSLGIAATYNRIDALMLSVSLEREQFDYWSERFEQETTEVGSLAPFATKYERITTDLTWRDYFVHTRPSTPVKTELRRKVQTSRPSGFSAFSISARTTEDYTFDSRGRLKTRTKLVEAIIPNPAQNFVPSLVDVLEEKENLTYAPHPFIPQTAYIRSREINVAGKIFIDGENQQLGEDYSRSAMQSYRAGNVVDTMTWKWDKISTYREEITPKPNRRVSIRTLEKDYLADQYTIDTDEDRDGDVGASLYVNEQRNIRIGANPILLGMESVNMGELPLSIAIALGRRILARQSTFANVFHFQLIGIDNTIQKGQPFNALGRDGEDLGNYIVEGRAMSGSEQGYQMSIEARQST